MNNIEESYDEVQRIKYELWSEDFNVELTAVASEDILVAEGDSWFDYPPGLDILDNLKREFGYKIYKVSEAGDTIENMAFGTEIRNNFSRRIPPLVETLDAIARHRPKVFLLSGGGNDITGLRLESFINHKDSGLPLLRQSYAEYILFTVFKIAYEYIIEQVWQIDPSIHIITHGYGNSIPDGRATINLPFGFKFIGPWLRPALAKKNITNPLEAEGLIASLIDMFNEMLQQLDQENQRFHYIDLRGLIQREDWVNELHLYNFAYRRVAGIFHDLIQALQ